jgi:hypothetical protein
LLQLFRVNFAASILIDHAEPLQNIMSVSRIEFPFPSLLKTVLESIAAQVQKQGGPA